MKQIILGSAIIVLSIWANGYEGPITIPSRKIRCALEQTHIEINGQNRFDMAIAQLVIIPPVENVNLGHTIIVFTNSTEIVTFYANSSLTGPWPEATSHILIDTEQARTKLEVGALSIDEIQMAEDGKPKSVSISFQGGGIRVKQ